MYVEHSIDQPTHGRKTTGLLSLPDEVLIRIVKQVGGKIQRGGPYLCYFRDADARCHLRNVCLVNERLSRIARMEIHRFPNTMVKDQQPLFSDHLQILYHPMIVQSAQGISLAGTSAFFAGSLESRFANLTSLALHFGIPNVNLRLVEEPEVLVKRHLARLRNALLALPLQDLYIYFQLGLELSREDYFQTIRLAAVHPTLRHFSVEGQSELRRKRSAKRETLADYGNATSSIESLTLRLFVGADVPELERALGKLPRLSNLACHDESQLGRCGGALGTLSVDVRDRIIHLDLRILELDDEVWRDLAGFPNLESLELQCYKQEDWTDGLEDAHLPRLPRLPRLAHITTRSRDHAVTTAVLEKAAQRHLLPVLAYLDIDMESGLDYCSGQGLAAMLAAYDELVARHPTIKVTPADYREVLVIQLAASEERERLRLASFRNLE